MAYEEPSFKIVHQTDKYEIRHYQERLAVQSNYTNQNSSFRNLFNYISGANKDSQKIKMTTPVTQYDKNSEIVMILAHSNQPIMPPISAEDDL